MNGAWTDSVTAGIASFVARHTGLDVARMGTGDVEAGIRRAMARAGLSSPAALRDALEAGTNAVDTLVSELTVGETYFMREPAHVAFIRDVVLPEVQRRRGSDHKVRIWSAGCATGEEAYSLAALLDATGVAGHVIATDLSRHALLRARQGTYRSWALRALDDWQITAFFDRTDDRWTIKPRLRKPVTFQYHNLARDAYPCLPSGLWAIDLIVCRNVLIYLDRDTVARVARGLFDTLAGGGWLLTGPSDPSLSDLAPLTAVVTPAGVFYRRDAPPARATIAPMPPPPALVRPAPIVERVAARLPDEAGDRSAAPLPPLDDARNALRAGRYEDALTLARTVDSPAGATLRMRAMANCRDVAATAAAVAGEIVRYPLCAELHLVEASVLVELNRPREAAEALRRVLYLDPSLAIANYLLGATLRASGRLDEARRAYRNARDLARSVPPDTELPLADGERAASLAATADAELMLLEAAS